MDFQFNSEWLNLYQSLVSAQNSFNPELPSPSNCPTLGLPDLTQLSQYDLAQLNSPDLQQISPDLIQHNFHDPNQVGSSQNVGLDFSNSLAQSQLDMSNFDLSNFALPSSFTLQSAPPTPQTPSFQFQPSLYSPALQTTSVDVMAPNRTGTTFQLNLPPIDFRGNGSNPWVNHVGVYKMPNTTTTPTLQPPAKLTVMKGDKEGVKLLMDRTVILHRKLDNCIANWTFAYHDRFMREWLQRNFYIYGTSIVCSKVVTNEGYVFGMYVMDKVETANNLMKLAARFSVVDGNPNYSIKVTSSESLVMAFSAAVKVESKTGRKKAKDVEEAVSDVFSLMMNPVKPAVPQYAQPRNVFFQ
ncbi:unnamed protein product [Bursaphelenchus xylophilus]|uniref:(pine wood nematode) hypothetical protein n=1 Tax=Bursaphelenchus xylophilus TaxID=6326 RepID=A0A1I7S5A8_BURXY|nr:unnamed protein product [Bursaphelenchus xylophilus]CAG9117879.1 unnamed protein product [Bursaphelenchus xylophilus]